MEHVGFYLAHVLYRTLPVFYETFADAIEAVYGQRLAVPKLLRFGTWVGGDMDGNPNVNAGTMRAALDAQRALALAQYRTDLRALHAAIRAALADEPGAPGAGGDDAVEPDDAVVPDDAAGPE